MTIERNESVGETAKSRILTSWKDERVARWVISQLPLLELAGSHPPVPIFDLDLESGLTLVSGGGDVDEFIGKMKLVISGGLEGTKGHIKIVKQMQESRALLGYSQDEAFVIVLLEPDDYIREEKEREPIVYLNVRASGWSASGLVNGVVRLPRRICGESKKEHYGKVHTFIEPAQWCVSIENPAWKEIVTRQGEKILDPSCVFDSEPEAHVSFLDSTKGMGLEELVVALGSYSVELADSTTTEQFLEILGGRDCYARLIYKRLAGGLRD